MRLTHQAYHSTNLLSVSVSTLLVCTAGLVANVHLEGIEEARRTSLSKSERVPKPMQATFNDIAAPVLRSNMPR